MYEYYLPFVGKPSPRMYHRVSADMIRAFAQAIGDDNPLYNDEAYAKTSPYGRLIAPPTFCLILKAEDIPGMWVAPAGRIHASQSFSYNRPICADELVSVDQVLTNTFEKTGKKGQMVFTEVTKNIYDEADALICSMKMTTITMANLFPADMSAAVPGAAVAAAAPAEKPSPRLESGMALPQIQLPPVKRRDIIRYAGASGDFNPIHLEDVEAQKLGYPTVIAHGMLTAALQGRVAETWVGSHYRLTDYNLKMTGPVFPEDVLSFNGCVTEADEAADTATIEYKVTNARGQDILSGAFKVAAV